MKSDKMIMIITSITTFVVFAALGYSSGKYSNTEIHSKFENELVTRHVQGGHIEVRRSHPWLKSSDLIYNGVRNTVPIVNEEYKVIFFLMAKVASTEFVRFFTRLQGNPNWCKINIHRPDVNKLKLLNSYSVEDAQEMMISADWKKVIFVRHPKERILSAFLDKAIQYSKRFVGEYCKAYGKKAVFDECVAKHEQFDFFLKEITTTLDLDVHWRTIYSRIDEKWWPYIDFIGNMETLSEDAHTFLSSIHSNIDGVSAWDRIGTSGWDNKNAKDCNEDVDNKKPFLSRGDPVHTTSANDKLKKFYTPELEAFVEEKYADDLQNPYFHFTPIKLFPHASE